jgi:NifB/MoaA-like Fe-S oxidoreductase
MEKYYQENPQMRPCKKKYEDIKFPLPTESWGDMLEKSEDNTEYLAFCDKAEAALKAFIGAIDENRKAVQKSLAVLMKELNKIEAETGSIGILEAEGLYDYIAKILRTLKKPRLIESMANMREW